MASKNYSRIAIISDLHGITSLKGLDKKLRKQRIETLVCLGDFDRTGTIREYMKLGKKYNTLAVPGNHDSDIFMEEGFESEELERMGKTSEELSKELKNDPKSYEFIKNLLTENSKTIFLNGNQTTFIHGAYDGDLSNSPFCQEEQLWFRLRLKKDYVANFKAMKKKGDRIMIRGHDHSPVYACKKGKNIEFETPSVNAAGFKLSKNAQHIVTVGALVDGWFATIDTNLEDVPILRYMRI